MQVFIKQKTLILQSIVKNQLLSNSKQIGVQIVKQWICGLTLLQKNIITIIGM